MKCVCLLALSVLFLQAATGGGKSRLKKYLSPDSAVVASVFTVIQEHNGDSESKVEFRTPKGVLLGAKSFMSKDHSRGLGVVKAVWTLDSEFFLFSTIASGGRQQGQFPTFFFSRRDNRLVMLDKVVGGNITSPEFEIEFPDVVTVTADTRLPDSKKSISTTRRLRLAEVKVK